MKIYFLSKKFDIKFIVKVGGIPVEMSLPYMYVKTPEMKEAERVPYCTVKEFKAGLKGLNVVVRIK